MSSPFTNVLRSQDFGHISVHPPPGHPINSVVFANEMPDSRHGSRMHGWLLWIPGRRNTVHYDVVEGQAPKIRDPKFGVYKIRAIRTICITAPDRDAGSGAVEVTLSV